MNNRPMDGYEIFCDGNSYIYYANTDEWRIIERLSVWPYIKVTKVPYYNMEDD